MDSRPILTIKLSRAEYLAVGLIIFLMMIDDLILGTFVSDINTYLIADYAKKGTLLAICFSMPAFRNIVKRAFSTPEVPWSGKGWLNPHLLILMVGFLLIDQGATWLSIHIHHLTGGVGYLGAPAYQENLVKYLDLTFGLALNSLAEETFYRAVLITALVGIFPRAVPCLLLAGVIFGLAHWTQGPVFVGAIMISGWLFGSLYYLTGSIVPGVIVHYLTNLIAFTS